jgi:hypothetical protein
MYCEKWVTRRLKALLIPASAGNRKIEDPHDGGAN